MSPGKPSAHAGTQRAFESAIKMLDINIIAGLAIMWLRTTCNAPRMASPDVAGAAEELYRLSAH
jgi:hypothetical protein